MKLNSAGTGLSAETTNTGAVFRALLTRAYASERLNLTLWFQTHIVHTEFDVTVFFISSRSGLVSRVSIEGF